MADSANIVVRTEQDGYRNLVIRASLVSDGSGLAAFKVYDATQHAVIAPGGQLIAPGIHTTLLALDYDVQDMKVRMQWDASSPEDILALGAAPQGFNWEDIGGLRVPSGLAGATGSILLTTVNPAPNATFGLVFYLRKNVPQG